MPSHYRLRPYDGERTAGVRKKLADPAKDQPVCCRERQSVWFTPAQHSNLLPKHEDFCFQRRSRSKQIGDKTKDQSEEIKHPAQRRPILYTTPIGFNYDSDRCRVIANAERSKAAGEHIWP
jgi:hypothetical protein